MKKYSVELFILSISIGYVLLSHFLTVLFHSSIYSALFLLVCSVVIYFVVWWKYK